MIHAGRCVQFHCTGVKTRPCVAKSPVDGWPKTIHNRANVTSKYAAPFHRHWFRFQECALVRIRAAPERRCTKTWAPEVHCVFRQKLRVCAIALAVVMHDKMKQPVFPGEKSGLFHPFIEARFACPEARRPLG